MLPDATVGEDLTVVWRRGSREWASSPAGVADDSSVEWGDACAQPVALRLAGAGWRPALCELEIRRVPRDAAGRPAGAGERVAACALDVAQFCAAGGAPARPPRRVDLPLRPSGVLRVAVAARALRAGALAAGGAASADGSPLTASPARSASGGASPRALPAAAAGDWEIRAVGSPHAGHASAARTSSTSSSTGGSSDAYLHRAGAGAATPGAGSAAGARGRSDDDGATPSEDDSLAPAPGGPSPDEGAIAALRRRVRRLERQREEARAEAFAESSERIQRGIEVEGLRRGRQALLARIAATEAQLVAAMRLDLEGGEEGGGEGADGGGGGAALVRALVDAKVALAEREFECMELAGKLRAREAAAAALEAHLAAAQAAAADGARARAPPPAADSPRRSWIGAKVAAAAGGSAGKAAALAAAALAPLEREAGAPVIELRAVAGPARASPEA